MDPVTITDPESIPVAKQPKRAAAKPKAEARSPKPSPRPEARGPRPSDKDEDGASPGSGTGTGTGTGTGSVRIYAKPWAYVEMGGKRVETPTTLTLPAGVHDISLYNPESNVRKTVTVTVRPGKPKTLNVRLVP
ncbi:MAG: hypothetical protein K8M05_06210 [Deltaproteobacteria bacterium]|nr:hypothetical protein [Kofleriaceae bacterium]